MYQNIFFDYYTKTAYLRDDQEGWSSFQYQPTYFRIDPKGEYHTLDGKRANPTNRYDKEDPNLYEKDVDINLRILLDIYKEYDDVPEWHNKVFFDIETEMGGAINIDYCKNAPVKVTAVALYDDNIKKYYAFLLDESSRIKDNLSRENVEVILCKNETSLFRSFLDRWEQIDPTIIISWNGDSFDVPYLYNRMRKVLGENAANRISPIGIVKFDEYDTKMPYKIGGIESLDYLRLYKKFIPKQQPSYALDFISNAELGYGKIKYEGSLDHLFQTDIEKYIEYNINDVKLIVDIDAKKKFIDLAVSVCHIGHVPYHHVYQSSKLLDGVIMTHLKRKNIVSPNKPTTNYPSLRKGFDVESEDDDKFAGAYVMEPTPGLYSWNIDFDLTSLYPSIIKKLNASPETYLFRIIKEDPVDTSWSLFNMKQKDPDTIVQIENSDGIVKYTKLRKLIRFIEKNGIICSPNGTYFLSEPIGTVCLVVQEWFDKRKYYKDLMKEAGKKGDKKNYNFYNTLQNIYKVLLNSIYGCLGLSSFRYSDGKDILAEAVTVSGRFVIISTSEWINNKINSEIYE